MTVSPRRRAARRRAPPPPAPAPVNTRRRTSSINGQTYTTTRRRAPASGSTTDVRRRRTAPPTSYGYASRPAVMNNYGGNMPVQTNYGYSGVAKPPNSNANIAMYAVGGAAVGAVAGAGPCMRTTTCTTAMLMACSADAEWGTTMMQSGAS